MDGQEERILVVAAAARAAAGIADGWTPEPIAALERLFAIDPGRYLPRPAVEEDAGLLQLVSYLALRCGDEVFCYRRAGGEGRLAGLWSLGIGGHVSEEDGPPGLEACESAAMRELLEEVELPEAFAGRWLGLVHDPATPVGAVHLGLAGVAELEAPEAMPLDAGLRDAGFRSLDWAAAQGDRFESWSRLLLERLRAGRP